MDYIGLPYYAVPNGVGKIRNFAHLNILKQIGIKRGVPDLHIPVPFPGYYSLYVETKTHAKHSKESNEQLAWHVLLRSLGHRVEVVRDTVAFENLMLECYPQYAIKMTHLKKRYELRNTKSS